MTEVRSLNGHTGIVNSVIFLYNGYIASGSDDMTILIWKWFITDAFSIAKFTYASTVKTLADLRNGKIAAGCGDNKIIIWSLTTGSIVNQLIGHSSYVVSLLYLGNSMLASGSFNPENKIILWDTDTNTAIGSMTAGDTIYALALLPSGLLASGHGRDNPAIRVWNMTVQTQTGSTSLVHSDAVRALVVLRNGYLCSGSRDAKIVVWDRKCHVFN